MPLANRLCPWLLSFFVLLGTCPGLASVPPSSHLVHLNHLRVGDSIKSLPTISRQVQHLAGGEKVGFYMYYFKAGLPSTCLNLECGTFANRIISNNGFLVGGADPRYTRELGMSVDSDSLGQGDSVLLVTDVDGKVTGIYKNLSLEGIGDIAAHIAHSE